MNRVIKKVSANVRRAVTQATVFMLFFATYSCEKPKDLFEFEETEVFTSRFYVHYVDNCGYLLLEDIEGLDNAGFYKPVNLPEEYQQEGLRVDVTYRYRLLRSEACNCSERSIEIEGIMETPETQTRITGGYTVNISQIPWQVAIVRMGSQACGGVIIAPGFILTAKHCVTIPDTQTPLPPGFIQVRAGVSCPIDPNSGNTFDVARIIVHPTANVDAALLQLSSNIIYNTNMQPINYWASAGNSSLYNPDNQVRTSGWGLMDITPGGNLIAAPCLQAVDLTIVPNHTTVTQWGTSLPAHEMVAAGTGNIRQGGCNGDSGGPLTIRSASGEQILIGIVKGGVTCVGTNQYALSVFTRVSSLVGWITLSTSTEQGVVINGTRWATRNVDWSGGFASHSEDKGLLYQWNRYPGWNVHDNAIWGWNSSASVGTTWERVNDPCPPGWRVPTRTEFQSLWTGTWTTRDGVNGRLFGTTPNQIFLPAANSRNRFGELETHASIEKHQHAFYWTSTGHIFDDHAHYFFFDSGGCRTAEAAHRASGYSIRCVLIE